MPGPSDAPLVSVCVPTYNGARFLQEALDSASAQTLGDLEILVVDDGSTDATLEIVRQHRERDPRVTLVRNERNLGLVGNWNRCLEVARGTWIKFLFQDDRLEPACLERMVAAGSEDAPFVVCGRRVLADEGAEAWVVEYLRTMPTLLGLVPQERLSPEAFAAVHARHLHENLVGEPPCVMLHRSLADRIGPFDATFRQMCDLEYWLRAGANVGVALVHEELAAFRAHGTSTTASNLARKVNVTDVDKILLTRKVQTDPRFARLRAALSGGASARNGLAVLSTLARAQAHVHDRTFAEAIGKDASLARRYALVRTLWVPALDGVRRAIRRKTPAA